MATRLKTIRFAFPTLASISDAVVTNFTQITVYIPESSPVFKKVAVTWGAGDIITATGGTWTEQRTGLRLGAAGYTTVTNTNDVAHSSENLCAVITADLTAHFTTNWTGTSMTCDLQVYADQSTGTTLGLVDAFAYVDITYEYDDTSATHIKTVCLPIGGLAVANANTTKPGTAQFDGTFPALDTICPEASKTYRAIWLEVEGAEGLGTSTVDLTWSWEIDSLGAYTTSNHERGLGFDRKWTYCYNLMSGGTPIFTTNATHSIYVWNSATGAFLYSSFKLYVTYEFSPGSTTTVLNSIQVPFSNVTLPSNTDITDPTVVEIPVWIDEPGTITKQLTAFEYWIENVSSNSSDVRIAPGTSGTYVTYGNTTTGLAGNYHRLQEFSTVTNGLTLARGLNRILLNVRDFAGATCSMTGFLLLNYHSGKASAGVGAHNHTVHWPVYLRDATATGQEFLSASVAPALPESAYFLNGVAAVFSLLGTSTGLSVNGYDYAVERLAAEQTAGVKGWDRLMAAYNYAVVMETGYYITVIDALWFFKQWPSDPRPALGSDGKPRVDIETARRWRWALHPPSNNKYPTFQLYVTYHSITFEKTTTVSSSGGGTVNASLCRKGPPVETVLTGSRSGNGTIVWTWYDDTANMLVEAREDATHVGRSNDFTFA